MAQDLIETLRVQFEQSADPVGSQVLTKIRKLESRAKAMKEEGYKPNEIRRELRGEIDTLKASARRAYAQTAESYRQQIDARVAELTEERYRKPERRALELAEVQNRIAGLTAEEASNLAQSYMSDAADLSLEELNALSARLDQTGEADQHRALRKVMGEKRAHEWWVGTDPEATAYDQQAQLLEKGASGVIPVQLPDGDVMEADLDNLIDLDNTLDEAVN